MTPAKILSAIGAIIVGIFAPRRKPAYQPVFVEPRPAEVLLKKEVRLWD